MICGVVPPAGVRSLVGGACRPGFIEGAPQRFGFGIGHHGNIGGLIERQQPALEALLVTAAARLLDETRVQAAQLGGIGDVIAPAVGGIEHVLFELRLQLGQLEHHRS